ncbi:MAG: hypothetical protein RJAPGHWK_000828, partial [Candidatus Fervidibacter sp.]
MQLEAKKFLLACLGCDGKLFVTKTALCARKIFKRNNIVETENTV